jgi:hypothetical protein
MQTTSDSGEAAKLNVRAKEQMNDGGTDYVTLPWEHAVNKAIVFRRGSSLKYPV